jgi:plastocyanin
MVNWRVDPGANTTIEITHTAVHWDSVPHPEPTGPAEYGDNLTAPEQGTIPANFSAELSFAEAGTYYYRAHAIIEGENYWSEEQTVAVGGTGTTQTVAIASGTAHLAAWESPVTIAVGDSIVWDNTDDFPHTATADEGSFDTGNVAAGSQSDPIVFPTAGTFTYHCSVHATMTGYQVTVEA